MANKENKLCQSCGLFDDCLKCNGSTIPPCAELAVENFIVNVKQMDTIALWKVRLWLRRNFNSNLTVAKKILIDMESIE